MNPKFIFIFVFILNFFIARNAESYVNRFTILSGGVFYLIDEAESDKRVPIISYSVKALFEFDISSKTDIAWSIGYAKPYVLADSTAFKDGYIFLNTQLGVKYYPISSKLTEYIEGIDKSILVEKKKMGLNPFISAGIASVYGINNSNDARFSNQLMLGIGIAMGLDYTLKGNIGLSIMFEQGTLSTLKSNPTIGFPFGFFTGFYVNF